MIILVQKNMEIWLNKEQENKIKNSKGHGDSYFVDVLLKSGEIKYNLSARERKCLVPSNACSPNDYNFGTKDIQDIRPSIGMIKRIFDPWKKSIKNKT